MNGHVILIATISCTIVALTALSMKYFFTPFPDDKIVSWSSVKEDIKNARNELRKVANQLNELSVLAETAEDDTMCTAMTPEGVKYTLRQIDPSENVWQVSHFAGPYVCAIDYEDYGQEKKVVCKRLENNTFTTDEQSILDSGEPVQKLINGLKIIDTMSPYESNDKLRISIPTLRRAAELLQK